MHFRLMKDSVASGRDVCEGERSMNFPVGPNEEERLKALLETGILDTAPDPAFDGITQEARRHFDVPMCLVTFIDRDRQWIKSAQGVCIPETPRDIAFCN